MASSKLWVRLNLALNGGVPDNQPFTVGEKVGVSFRYLRAGFVPRLFRYDFGGVRTYTYQQVVHVSVVGVDVQDVGTCRLTVGCNTEQEVFIVLPNTTVLYDNIEEVGHGSSL